MPDRAGQQLGNYRLLRLLGRGGFAEVYLGEHVYLKRRAALKVLHIALEEEDVEHFLAEAQVLARLDHPNIVRVHEFAVEQGTPFLVMEYASRGTLRKLHPRGSLLSLQTTLAYVKQIAAALQYAHNHNVIHRDVKPENMLLGSQQEVLLSDFGISLLSPSPEQLSTQEMAGTLPYMAPEQIRGKPVFASDQYSLAVVVYEWLCGVRPFEGPSWQIAYQQVSDPPSPLREHDPSLPEAVEEVVLKALAKDPRERYVSVNLFAQALERACQEQPLDLRSETDVTAPLGQPSPAPPVTPTVVPRRVFVVAASADDAFVARLTADMQRHGIACWQEGPDNTGRIHEQEHTLRQAIRAVEVVLVVVSPEARSSRTVKACLRIASLYQRQLVFVWAVGEEIANVLPPAWDDKTVQIDLVDAREKRYEEALEELLVSLEAEASVEEFTLPEPVTEPRNPYKGLRPFTQADAADFFGRDRLIEELVERVKTLVTGESPGIPTARLLAVIGPSGSGKSSVVMAGLLPRLRQGVLPGSRQGVYLEPMVPGAHPLEALALTLAPRLPDRSLKNLREDLQDESARGLHLLAKQLSTAAEQKVVLLVDQFEELFTLTTSEEERQQFIDLLTTAVTEPQGVIIVLLTLRADFYDRPMAYPAFHQLLETHQKSVLPMEVQDLRAVIKRPAVLPDVQLSFEGNLVGDLLFEVQGEAGALPLLQFTLEQLFQRRNGHTLTLAAYQEIGGVKGALAKHAEATYTALPSEEHRRLARALFLRLIDPGLTEQDTTRRRAAFTELALPDARQTALLKETADAFIAARLLTTNEIAGTTTVEVSHEALIREWSRLSDWLHEAREDIRLQQAISEDAAEWQRHGQPRDRLYRGSQLKDARTWARRNLPSTREIAFLRASATQRMRSVLSMIVVVLLLLSSTGIAGWFFLHQSPDPTHVTNLRDDGVGSLRWAIANAPPGSTITFDASLRGTIIFPKRQDINLPIGRNLTIRGPGAGVLAISGGKLVFEVSKGVSATIANLTIKNSGEGILNEGTLSLINSTVSHNTVDNTTGSDGGGIVNAGTLSLLNSTVSDNESRLFGGGILNDGTLSLINSTVSHNTGFAGGGIDIGDSIGASNAQAQAQATLINSTVSDNSSINVEASGGGILNGGTLSLLNSTVSHNTALADVAGGTGYGGGILNSGTLSLLNSTVSGNSASTDGGGIVNAGTLSLLNSTVSGNSASGPNGEGGGIAIGYSIGAGPAQAQTHTQATLLNSTVSDNSASTEGGGILVQGPIRSSIQADLTFSTVYGNRAAVGADIAVKDGSYLTISRGLPPKQVFKPSKQFSQVKLRNSIVAGDPAHPSSDIVGMLTSYGYNLFQDNSGATFDPATSKLNSTDKTVSVNDLPGLFASPVGLLNNGGPTRTYALGPNSPAVDQIPLQYCQVKDIFDNQSRIYTDQRGMKRPDGNEQFCDIGAYESSS